MAYKFNPFTDTLDLVGSSDSYIDGEVQYHSNLPVTLGSPAVNSAFLVRKGEGLYFISRKPAGIWVRELNNGNLDDWKYAGTFSDLYRDANFRIINDADVSKELAFSLSGITTGTTRTLTAPNKSGTIALTTDIPSVNDIELETDGTTTITTAQLPARGIAYAPEGESTYTVNLPTPDIRQSGLTFSLKTEYEEGSGTVFVTVVHAAVNLLTTYELDEDEGSIDFLWDGYAWTYDTAYRLRSFPSRVLQLPAASGTIARTEDFAAPPAIGSTTPNTGAFTSLSANNGVESNQRFSTAGSSLQLRQSSTTYQIYQGFFGPTNNAHGFALGANQDLTLLRDAADTLAQRRSTNPQTFRIYTTYGGTGGADFERLFIKGQTLGAFQIGTEKGGTGSARALEFQTDGTTRVTILSTGQMGIGTTNPNRSLHISDAAAMGRIDRIGGNGPAFLMTRMAVLGTVTSSWLFGPATGFASVANDDFSIIDFGTAVGGVSGTQRLTIAKSDGQLTVNGNLNLATKDLVTDTTTGTKIGTATTQKIGFFNATPVVQQAAVADATDAATAITQLNDLLAAMRTLGLIAT